MAIINLLTFCLTCWKLVSDLSGEKVDNLKRCCELFQVTKLYEIHSCFEFLQVSGKEARTREGKNIKRTVI